MKRFVHHLFTGCVFVPLLLIFLTSLGQNQIVPVKIQYKTNPVKEYFNLKSGQISNVHAEEIVDQIQTGKWIATTGTGFAFEFVVNDDATKITQFKVIFTDYTCGSSTHNGSVTTTSNWSINNGEFVIDDKDYFTNEEFIISGTFSSSGIQASGNWEYKSNYGNCSGTWTATTEIFPKIILIPEQFASIQEGINVANSGDTVVVSEGTYHENNIQMKSGVVVRGAGIDLSIVDGDSLTVFWGADAAVIEGFTIINASKSFERGIFCWSSNPVIQNNKIANCYNGISVADNAVIKNNIIFNNANSGIFCGSSNPDNSPEISRNLIAFNEGDGITSVSSDISAFNNTVDNNSVGIWVQKSSGAITPVKIIAKNNIISSNSRYGLYLSGSDTYGVNPDDMSIIYNDIWNNSPNYSSNCKPHDTDISSDPLYNAKNYKTGIINKSGKDILSNSDRVALNNYLNKLYSKNDHQNLNNEDYFLSNKFNILDLKSGEDIVPEDYYLKSNSPCIDAGDPESQKDPDKTRADLGAFYFDQNQLPDLIAIAGGFEPDEASLGEILNVNVTVKNTGLSKADSNTVAFYLCEDPDISVTDILIGTAPVSALNAGEEAAVEIMYEITDNLPVGAYYIGYQLDYFNSVEEIENDNYYYLPESPFIRLANPEFIVANKISDIILYIDSVNFTFDLEVPPAVFYYSNPEVSLSYSINSSDATVASPSISGSIIKVLPLSEGTAIITVTANDGKGETVSTDFQVEIKQKIHTSPGKFGGCLVLDGIDDYAEAFDHYELDLGNQDKKSFTIEAWVKFEEFGSADIISKSNAYRLYTETSTALGNKTRVLGFIVHSGASNLITAVGKTVYGGGFWIEGWHHVAGVYNDLTGELSLYMDGEQLSSWESGNVQINNSSTPLKVGSNLDGLVDEMRISKSARYNGESYEVPVAPFFTDENTTALWHFDDPLESMECQDCCKENNCLFLFKGAFITSIESFDEKDSDHFELLQNYPNPFNGSTTIDFNVLKTSNLLIRVYDILGHEVKTLIDGKYLPGTYQIIWNGKNYEGSDLGSGIYLVKMQSGEFMSVKKVLLKRN